MGTRDAPDVFPAQLVDGSEVVAWIATAANFDPVAGSHRTLTDRPRPVISPARVMVTKVTVSPDVDSTTHR